MIYQSRIFHLFKPTTTFYQLAKAEAIYGLTLRLFLMFILSALIFAGSGILGIGTDVFSKTLIVDSSDVFQWHKALFVGGRILSGLLYAASILFIPSLFYGIFAEIPYRKLVVIQLFVLFILLIEQSLSIPFALWLDLEWYSSPLTFGILTKYVSSNIFLVAFFGCISLFKIWAMYLQFKGLCSLSDKKRSTLLILVLSINIIFWAFTALITYIDFYQML